jgi:hypothetical protein
MENFNKNWLAILLIVIVFWTLGFLMGWTLKPVHHSGIGMGMKMMNKCCDDPEMFDIPLCGKGIDSLEEVDVKVIVDGEDVLKSCSDSSHKKVIIKKIIK